MKKLSTKENILAAEVSAPKVAYGMFRFQSFLEHLQVEYNSADLPLELDRSYIIEISDGKIKFAVHPQQTNPEISNRLYEIAKESFGCWLSN